MRADISRKTYRKKNHISKVISQQGRVFVDSDWNEQVDIQQHREQTPLKDVLGLSGTSFKDPGFAIKPSASGKTYIVGKGRYYVDGILCENEADTDALDQEDLPVKSNADGSIETPAFPSKVGPAPKKGYYLVYLDVWERHISWLDNPLIREVALGGADTSARAKTIWQVKLKFIEPTIPEDFDPSKFLKDVFGQPRGKLSAKHETQGILDQYDGFENQLYRIEIHEGGQLNQAKFKWSKNNASVAVTIAESTQEIVKSDGSIEVNSDCLNILHNFPAHPDTPSFVEVTNDQIELWGLPGVFAELDHTELSENKIFLKNNTVEEKDAITKINSTFSSQKGKGNPKIRLWDSSGSNLLSTSYSPLGSTGISVQFHGDDAYFRTGDYWLIPIRLGSGGIIDWPTTNNQPDAVEPDGNEHHYCPLALLFYDADSAVFTSPSNGGDYREFFNPITENIELNPISGNSIVASPGSTIKLAVTASVGKLPLRNCKVNFVVTPENGKLGTDPAQIIVTNINVTVQSNGIAQCLWKLDDSKPNQQVKASLLDFTNKDLNAPPLFFNAFLPVSLYPVSSSSFMALPNSEVAITAGASLGKTPLTGFKMRFDAGGNSETKDLTNGLATYTWKLGTDQTQNAKVTLVDSNGQDSTLPPLYFNATVSDLPVNMATSGIIKVQIPAPSLKKAGLGKTGQFRFDSFSHGLTVKFPPAIILGKITTLGKVSSIDPYVRPLDITKEKFSILLIGNFKTGQIVWINWWAIPTTQVAETTRFEAPAITFNPKTISLELEKEVKGKVVITVTDASAKTTLDAAESVELSLPQASARAVIKAKETDKNTGVFVTEDIEIIQTAAPGRGRTARVPEYGLKVGRRTLTLPTLFRDGKIVVLYKSPTGHTFEAIVTLVGIEFTTDSGGKITGIRIIDGAVKGDITARRNTIFSVVLMQQGETKTTDISASETEPNSGIYAVTAKATPDRSNPKNALLSTKGIKLSVSPDAQITVNYRASNGETVSKTLNTSLLKP